MYVFGCLPQDGLDGTFSWLLGMASFPLLPTTQEEEEDEEEDEGMIGKETEKQKEERKSDHEVARQDVVKVSVASWLSLLLLLFTLCFVLAYSVCFLC